MQSLLIHIHVPKCAGTTVEQHLNLTLGAGETWFPPQRTRNFPLGWFGPKYDSHPPGSLNKIRAVSGHFIGRPIEKLFNDRRIVRSILLREPESLMLSYYNYRIERYISLGQHPYPFSLFLRATRQDFATHFLLERWLELPWARMALLSDEQKIALVDGIMASIPYVDAIDETDALIGKISREVGASPTAQRRNTAEELQKGTGWKTLRASDLSELERNELRSRTNLDQYLWRRWVLKQDGALHRHMPRNQFVRSELFRPKYQFERRLFRSFGLSPVRPTNQVSAVP